MATLSPTELLNWLGQYQLLSPKQTEELRPLLPTFPDSHTLGRELISRDWLTPYQVNQILQGKHGELVLGAYRLRERLGEGAMGQVFKAWDVDLARIVALKTIHKEKVNSPKAVDRFRREVDTAAKLNHPNIALVIAAGEEEGRPFLVMDFIEGVDLSRRVKQRGALPIAEAVEYIRQAALGLQHAHERGIVHRDIKPANLMIIGSQVKILDFGLARYESERENANRLTQVGNLLGTVDYVAPEQAQDAGSADIRADIYSLGCSLFYLLTGHPPFPGNTVVEKIGPRLTGEPPWVRGARPEVSPALEEVLRKLMARRPDDRYQTPVEAAQALEPFAMPIPLAMPATGIVMALPVETAVGAVPLATPVSERSADDPAFLGMTATGRDMSAGPAGVRQAAKPKKPIPVKLLVLLGGGAICLGMFVCAGSWLYSYFFPPGPRRSEGVLVISEAKFSVPDQTIRPGESKFVNVRIERVKFKGTVKLTLEGLPDGVRMAEPHYLPPNTDKGQIRFAVSFGTEPMKKRIRVHAECEAEGIMADYSLDLVIVPDPLKKK